MLATASTDDWVGGDSAGIGAVGGVVVEGDVGGREKVDVGADGGGLLLVEGGGLTDGVFVGTDDHPTNGSCGGEDTDIGELLSFKSFVDFEPPLL